MNATPITVRARVRVLNDGANNKNTICRTSRRVFGVTQHLSYKHKQTWEKTGEGKLAKSTIERLSAPMNNKHIHIHSHIQTSISYFISTLFVCRLMPAYVMRTAASYGEATDSQLKCKRSIASAW